MQPGYRVARAVITMAAALLVLTGCFYDPGPARMQIVNDTGVELRIDDGSGLVAIMRASGRETVPLRFPPDQCMPRMILRAVTADGTRAATFGPPVCDGNEWVITEKDLLLAPTPTPGATGP